MAKVDVAWYNPEETVIRYSLHKGCTWQDILEIIPQSSAMMNSVDHEVIDVWFINGVVPKGNLLNLMKPLFQHPPDNLRALIVVGAPTYLHRLVEISLTTYRKIRFTENQNMFFVRDAEEAETLLRQLMEPTT